jgi:molybdopterin molybdotransferase
MDIEISITKEPIAENQHHSLLSGAAGALAEFRGIIRGQEEGRQITALDYEAYQPMAEKEMQRILEELGTAHPFLSARVVHRIGVVPVDAVAIYIGVTAKHRAEAFIILSDFMDRLKQDVPIWKRRAIFQDGKAADTLDQQAPLERTAASASPAPVTSDGVLTVVRGICRPLAAERVALAGAAGRVLVEPVCAPEDQPPFDRSAVDGYAIRPDDSGTCFRIVDEIRAGDWRPRQLMPGETVRIATGGALPCEGLQVAMREDAERRGDTLVLQHRNGDRNIRSKGDDARAGQELVATGTVLQPGTLALLAGLGAAELKVRRLPRVLHVATGNEIVPPDQSPGPGQIRDSNSTLVRAFLGQWGIMPEQIRAPEDEAQAFELLSQRMPAAPGATPPPCTPSAKDGSAIASRENSPDVLLISGGASVGEHDFTRRLLEQLGFSILVSKTAARPGKPLLVARRGDTIAFGLPGNPLAHFVCLNLYVRIALEAFNGCTGGSIFHQGFLAEDLDGRDERRETFWPARSTFKDGTARLWPLRWASSGDLTSLATANALIRLAVGTAPVHAGTRVDFVSTSRGL